MSIQIIIVSTLYACPDLQLTSENGASEVPHQTKGNDMWHMYSHVLQ